MCLLTNISVYISIVKHTRTYSLQPSRDMHQLIFLVLFKFVLKTFLNNYKFVKLIKTKRIYVILLSVLDD